MNICGCLVHALSDAPETIARQMEALDGVEIHARSDDGRYVVVVEDTDNQAAAEAIMQLHQIPGVISVTLTYHHFEDPQAMARPGLHLPNSAGEQTNDRI